MKIVIIGAGYVGLSTAAILANCDNEVTLIDINQKRLSAIEEGHSFFYEEGIDPLINNAVNSKKLKPTNQYGIAVEEADIIFSCVGTPENKDGSSNLDYVFAAAKTSATLMKKGAIFVQKSTVPVGTGKALQDTINRQDISYVSNPEFLREGTAIEDSLYFDRVVCGGDDPASISVVFKIFKAIENNRDKLANLARINIKTSVIRPEYIATNLESAELIKVTANAFLALKISFANSIAKLADTVGADITEVMDAVGQDKRIGKAFLNAGRGYGGGCFPKDVNGLIKSMERHSTDPQILQAAQLTNQSMPKYIVKQLERICGKLSGQQFTVLGLSFKAGTSDVRESPGIKIANLLKKHGAIVHAYDPKANAEAKEYLHKSIQLKSDCNQAMEGSAAILITTEWEEFRNLEPGILNRLLTGKKLVYDCMNIFNPSDAIKAGLQYKGIGR